MATTPNVSDGSDPAQEHWNEEQQKKDALWAHFQKFIADNNITCAETVFQTDRVIVNAYDFIHHGCDIVGYAKVEE